jgi:CHAT domain-containing protein
MEQAKSRSLVELMFGRGNPLLRSATENAHSERICALRRELNWYYRRIEIEQTRGESMSFAQINSLRAEAYTREDELLRALRELPRTSQFDGIQQPVAALTLQQIREVLHPKSTLLEYFQVGPQIVAAVLSRKNVKIIQLGPASKITACLRMLDFQLSKSFSGKLNNGTFEEHLLAATESRLRDLYQQLVAPLASVLKGCHLVVVPHGVLHYVPFHALLDGSEYLIDRFSISYAPSASTHAICYRKPANLNGYSLLLGVPDERTPWIRQEIRSVAEVVPRPKVYLGRSATVQALREAGAAACLIHIATHGFFRRDNPMFSSVRLADSYLNLYDLYELRLPVELLTLSGCGTGLSVVEAGDELLGLIRGLLSAGAQCLLLTLWDIHDRSTAEFMTCFYKRLQTESNKALALRDAMLEFRKRRPHPFYWAPFVLVGKISDSSKI